MKTIKETKTIEKIVGYEAYDGTRFDTEDECKRYEGLANNVIKKKFKNLVIKEIESCDITDWGDAYYGATIGEDWYIALVYIKDEKDLMIAQMFQSSTGDCINGLFDESMIGKKVIVSIGSGIYPIPKSGKKCTYDYCYVWGTIEDQVKAYEKALKKLEEIDN